MGRGRAGGDLGRIDGVEQTRGSATSTDASNAASDSPRTVPPLVTRYDA